MAMNEIESVKQTELFDELIESPEYVVHKLTIVKEDMQELESMGFEMPAGFEQLLNGYIESATIVRDKKGEEYLDQLP